jgi:uncharacterized membrane protein HdeD (DUF308 family)
VSTPGIVDQVVTALDSRHRLATALGGLLGAVVPVATYVVAHQETSDTGPLWAQPAAFLVAGGLAYSATTVYQWARLAFGHPVKALGFVVLLEGTMVASQTPWLAIVALVYLAAINAIATGCTLALARTAPRRASTRNRRVSRPRLRAVAS